MSALIAVACVLAVLLALCFLRVGGQAEYGSGGVKLRLRVGFLKFTLYPRKERGKKTAEKEAGEEPKKGGALPPLTELLKLACEAAGELAGKLRIDDLRLDLAVPGGADAAAGALAFGGANAALGMLWPLLEQNFVIRSHQIRTTVDFQAKESFVYALAAFSARLGALIAFAFRFGPRAMDLMRAQKAKQKEAL